ncbi:MAG: TVP38/TMEM64 family protein, partial [Planctomycetaceae bacterium]|nr:TVP38/TMEM64 family protein [Planctomycetaceae bacterium]
LVATFGLIWAMPIRALAELLQDWSNEAGIWGPSLYLGAFVLFTLISLPVWPMPFVAGAVYGPWMGTALASFSCVLAAAVTFYVARLIGRTAIRQRLEASPRMRALERTIDQAKWKVVAAVRLSHFLTFGMQNYAFGLTSIPFRTFLVTTWLVTFPGIMLQVYLGDLGFASMESWQSDAALDWQKWGLRLGGLVAVVAAVSYIGYLGRTVYRDSVKETLEHAVEEEMSKQQGRESVSWSVIALGSFALLFAAASLWAVIEHEALRQFVEQTLPAAAAVRGWDSLGARHV